VVERERETETPPAGFLSGTFRSLRVRNFRLFVGGQLISGIGSWMAMVAGPWLVWELTHSGVMLGLDTLFGSLPILLVGAWGGLIADRFDNRLAQIWTQSAYCVVVLALWALVVTDVVQVWMVFVDSFLLGIVNAIDMPVRQSFYLEMVGPEDLTNAMSLNTATFTGTRIVGPVIAGALIGVFGVGPVFLVDGLSYLAVVAALLAMRVSELRPRERVPRGKGQVREGVRYVWRTLDLRLPMLLMLVVFLFAYNFMVFMPLMAVRTFHGDAATLGSMLSLFGIGSLTGALLMASRASRPSISRMIALAFAVAGLSIALAVSPALPVAWIVLPFLGAAYISFPISGNSTLQLTSAPEMRGRVMSLYTVVFLGSTPIGGPLAGFVGQHLGPRIGVAGGAAIGATAAAATVLALRRRRRASGSQ
jgi:MFS family permease